MKTETIVLIAAVFSLALAFGCIGGGGENQTTSGEAYTLDLSQKMINPEGSTFINLKIKNIFDDDMTNVSISLKDAPGFTIANQTQNGVIIPKGQEYTANWQLTAPSTDLRQTVQPKIRVCFDYDTNFYFDTAIIPTDKSTEKVQTLSGHSNGPISISEMGLDKIYLTGNNFAQGSLSIKNNWIGKINSISEISITSGKDLSGGIWYSSCGSYSSSKITNCDLFNKSLAIGNGLTASIRLNATKSNLDDIELSRTTGIVKYRYCYDIDVGVITVCPIGQRC